MHASIANQTLVHMKKFYLLVALLAGLQTLSAQTISLNELLNMAGIGASKFQQYASRKGFQTEERQQDFVRMQYTRDTANAFFISRQWNGRGGWLRLEKITATDYELLKQRIKADGFVAGELKAKVHTELFEKGSLLITASPEIDLEEGKRLYNIVIQNKPLPKAKDLQFAEDLLQFDSHQQLVQVFGAGNVRKDAFIADDESQQPCSVIFPQSPYEAVFIWNDGNNMRILEQVRVGGNPHTRSSLQYSNSVSQNRWVSKQGVYPTMTLDQLVAHNESPVSFYGWGAENSGMLCSTSTAGKLDLSQLSFVFSCFNCNDEKYYGDARHNANDVIRESRRVHIATMILKPETLEELTAGHNRK